MHTFCALFGFGSIWHWLIAPMPFKGTSLSPKQLDNSLCARERIYIPTSDIRRPLIGIPIVDHSDVVAASPVGSTYIFIGDLIPGFSGLGRENCMTGIKTFKFLRFGAAYIRCFTVSNFIQRMHQKHNKDTTNQPQQNVVHGLWDIFHLSNC